MVEVEEWLSGLPVKEYEDKEDHVLMILDGHLIRGPPGFVRLLTEEFAFDFYQDDVVKIDLCEVSREDSHDGFAIPIRLFVRIGARIGYISPSKPYKNLIQKIKIPFAISSRPNDKSCPVSSEYTALARVFLRRHNIDE